MEYKKDGFKFFKGTSTNENILGDRFILESDKVAESINYINHNSVKSILINQNYFNAKDLSMLSEIQNIEGLFILLPEIMFENLSSLERLKVLRTGKIIGDVDFSNFKSLEVLACDYHKKFKNLYTCENLFDIWFDNFNEDSLCNLIGLRKLKFLSLYNTKIVNFKYIHELSSLEIIRIDNAKFLSSLEGIGEDNKLKIIDVYNAKNLTNYQSVSNCINLEKLFLSKTGDLQSLDFLKNLSKIETIGLGLKITDGNLEFIRKISQVGFKDYPHYNYKMKDFR